MPSPQRPVSCALQSLILEDHIAVEVVQDIKKCRIESGELGAI
jgi:hypothetical protein